MELTVELLRKVDNFDFFHLRTFEAAADFAAAQLVNTDRTVVCFTEVCFTEVYKGFPLHYVGVTKRLRPPLVTVMGGKRYVRSHGHLVPEEEAA